ncbi:Protein C10C5.4 [Aphelenchoides avenae]|nr:Protein C10C5.4 [Aphelenchus avenae]
MPAYHAEFSTVERPQPPLVDSIAEEHPAVSKFRKYLQIKTEQPEPDYEGCKQFLLDYAKEMGVEAWTHECVIGKPFVGMTIPGQDPSLPSLVLYSHTDVVPTFPEEWSYDPYSGYKDAEGNIFGRGAQDTKCLGIQYMEAVRRLKRAGELPCLRTIHILWGPDEEIGGDDGMEKFVETDKFKEMNVGFMLDESHASPTETFVIHYAERVTWWLKVTCCGTAGHGSRFIEDHAGGKFTRMLQHFLAFRDEQKKKLDDSNGTLGLGDVVTVNLTQIEGGVQPNVVPAHLCAQFDIRVPPHADFKKLEDDIVQWCAHSGPNVKPDFLKKREDRAMTPISEDDPWWSAFSSVFKEGGWKIAPQIAAGGSDSKFLRNLGIRAIGFSPTHHTPIIHHQNNEFVNEKIFLRGIDIFEKLIPRLANLPKHDFDTPVPA